MRWLLFGTLMFSTAFLFIPVTEVREFFPFSEVTIAMDTWFYFLFEHLNVLILGISLLLPRKREDEIYIKVYIFIQVIDTLDYLLFYGEQWTVYIPTWNLLKVSLFGLTIVHQSWKHLAARS